MHRSLTMFFSVGVVLIAGSMLMRDLNKSGKLHSSKATNEHFLEELNGGVDVARASISPDYLKQVVDNGKLREVGETQNQPELKQSLKDKVMGIFSRLHHG